MGGLPHRLDLVRPLAVNGLRLRASRPAPKSTAPRCWRWRWPNWRCAGGERAGLIGLTPPLASRDVVERFAEAAAADERLHGASAAGLPPPAPIKARSQVVLIGDFLGDADDGRARRSRPSPRSGAEGQVVMIADPIEETFPFIGHTEFLAAVGAGRLRAPRAQSLRGAYLERLTAHREAMRAACAARGWGFALHRTDQSAAQALLALRARLAGPEPAKAGWSA